MGDRVFFPYAGKMLAGTISRIDRRRIRPYSISGQMFRYHDDQLAPCTDYNGVLKELLAK